MQFYISVMLLGFPDKIHEEKPSFLDFENNWLRTDGPTDGRTDRPSYRDARTHLKRREGINSFLYPGFVVTIYVLSFLLYFVFLTIVVLLYETGQAV